MALSDAPRCTAKSKSTGKQCRCAAVTGSTKCRLHGGKTPTGMASPNFKTGRYSKHLPTGLLDAYNDAQADADLKDQRASIALIDAMIAGILPNINTADNEKAWVAMRQLVADCRYAYATENFAKLEAALKTMDDWANLRIKHYESIEQTRILLDTRRRHVESEEKLALAGERALSVESVMVLMSQVLNIITSVVTDRSQRYAIADEIQRLVSRSASVELPE